MSSSPILESWAAAAALSFSRPLSALKKHWKAGRGVVSHSFFTTSIWPQATFKCILDLGTYMVFSFFICGNAMICVWRYGICESRWILHKSQQLFKIPFVFAIAGPSKKNPINFHGSREAITVHANLFFFPSLPFPTYRVTFCFWWLFHQDSRF